MKILFATLVSRNKGYTLVEFLVVMAIVAFITSAIVLNIFGWPNPIQASQTSTSADASEIIPGDDASQQDIPEGLLPDVESIADKTEFQIIQTALDIMMIRTRLTGVKETQLTRNMSEFPLDNPLYPGFLRNKTTRCRYSCDSSGQIIQSK